MLGGSDPTPASTARAAAECPSPNTGRSEAVHGLVIRNATYIEAPQRRALSAGLPRERAALTRLPPGRHTVRSASQLTLSSGDVAESDLYLLFLIVSIEHITAMSTNTTVLCVFNSCPSCNSQKGRLCYWRSQGSSFPR